MTKEITKAIILEEIQNKFRLRDMIPEKFTFEESVIPTYNIEPHLEKIQRVVKGIGIAATGGVAYFTVPDTEEWLLHRYNVIFVTGVFTIAGVFIGRKSAAEYIYLDLTASQNTSYANDLPKDVKLGAGDGIFINVDGYTSTGNMILICDVTKEEIR